MSLKPDLPEILARMRNDLRIGLPVCLKDRARWVLCVAVESLTKARLEALRQIGSPQLVLTARRAETLKAIAYDGDLARILVPDRADLQWLRAMTDPANDLAAPMRGPFRMVREGAADAERAALKLCKQARLLPAVLTVSLSSDQLGEMEELSLVDLSEAMAGLAQPVNLDLVSRASLPMQVSESGQVHVFRPDDGGPEHYAIVIGQPDQQSAPLCRLHSACFTGDLLGSLKCDCGPQLRAALDQIGREGHGVLLYLNQEGRGIGLANKMRAYSLQDQGFDTVEANHRLGFEDDERDFLIGAAILQKLTISKIRLLTNNPQKIRMMEQAGLTVEKRVALKVGRTRQNADYLDTKKAKSGHLL